MRWLLVVVALLAWTTTAIAEDTRFAEPGHGYTLHYPSTWTLSAPGPFAVVLRPSSATAGGDVAVSIENVRQPDDSGLLEGVTLLARRYLDELAGHALQVEVHRQAPFLWHTGDGLVMTGQQVVADFVREEVPYRQWAVFLPNPAGPVVHVWLFTAPQDQFSDWRPAAEGILQSIQAARK